MYGVRPVSQCQLKLILHLQWSQVFLRHLQVVHVSELSQYSPGGLITTSLDIQTMQKQETCEALFTVWVLRWTGHWILWLWSSRMWHHTVWYTGRHILEPPAAITSTAYWYDSLWKMRWTWKERTCSFNHHGITLVPISHSCTPDDHNRNTQVPW